MLTINSALLSLKNICWDEHNCLVSSSRLGQKQENAFCVSRNCLQYEPDHPIHIRTLSLVHSHVSESGSFDTLIATRFHLICFWNKLGLKCVAGTMGRWCSTCVGTSSKMNCLFIWWWTTGSYQLDDSKTQISWVMKEASLYGFPQSGGGSGRHCCLPANSP